MSNDNVIENSQEVSPFADVRLVDLPVAEQSRYGNDQFRSVMELQVGMANNEFNPKILRVNRSGQWMGQQKFVQILGEPVNNKPIKYQVDMLGNITATSFKTAASGKRVQIFNDLIIIYDDNGIKRVEFNGPFEVFYDDTGVRQGIITGGNVPQPSLFIIGQDALVLSTINMPHLTFFDSLALGVWSTLMVFANLAVDPTPINGGMYYNTGTDKFRKCEAGVWSDVT